MAAPTVNEQIADEATTHAINMLRVAANARAFVLAELKRLETSLVKEIASLTGDESVFKVGRLNALLKQTRASINATYKTIAAQQQATLSKVAGTEQAKAAQIVNNAIGIEAVTVAMTETQLETLAGKALIRGQFSEKWWDKQAAALRERFLIAMRDGMQRGEGVADLIRRVRGTKAAGFNDGVMALSRAQAEALVRTSVIAVSNLARIKTFLQNLDVIKGVQWRSTLDSRTTEICLALDGKEWSLPDFEPIGHALKWPGETAHWNCRSTQVAVTYSFAELAAREAVDTATVPTALAVPTPGKFIDHKPGMPKDTLALYTDANGVLTAERQALHDKIVESFFANATPVPKGERLAIAMMGGTASGKSSIVNEFLEGWGGNFVRVDADLIKEMLPEFAEGVAARARDAASIVHEESSILAGRIRQQALAGGYNIIADGTGANAAKYATLLSSWKEEGYYVQLMASHNTVERGLAFAEERALKKGRFVMEDEVRRIYANIPGSFAQNRGLADGFMLFENTGSTPRLVWQLNEGGESVFDEHFAELYGHH